MSALSRRNFLALTGSVAAVAVSGCDDDTTAPSTDMTANAKDMAGPRDLAEEHD